jgi:monoamine oxidase
MILFSKRLWKAVLSTLSICGMLVGSSIAMDEAKSCEIAIIGGGMAGLTAAYNLNKQGISCCLFEAKDYPGGRTHTHYFTDDKSQYYEEGGTTIDHDHKSVISLAKELNVKLDEVHFGEGKVSVFQNGKHLPEKELIHIFEESKKVFKKEVKPSYSAVDDKFPSIITVIDKLESENAKSFWHTFIKDECGVEPKDAPIYQLGWLAETAEEYGQMLTYRGSMLTKWMVNMYYSYRVRGGMSNLVNALQHKCTSTKFHFGHVLNGIRKDDSGYHLTFTNQQPIIAKKVLMAIPFSTLRDVKIDEHMGLSYICKEAIHNLRYGTNAKIGLPVSGKFEMLHHINLGPKDQFISWPGYNAVTIMLGGDAGKDLTLESAEKLLVTENDNLQVAYPKIGKIGKPSIKNWAQDPYAKGSYSAHTTQPNDFSNLQSQQYPLLCEYAQPINNNTFVFAGEHTIYGAGRAHIEGAVQSGELAAKIISGKK